MNIKVLSIEEISLFKKGQFNKRISFGYTGTLWVKIIKDQKKICQSTASWKINMIYEENDIPYVPEVLYNFTIWVYYENCTRLLEHAIEKYMELWFDTHGLSQN